MSDVVVLTFDTIDDAEKARETVRQLERAGRLSLDDAAILVKDADGQIREHGEIDRSVKVGTGVGAALGLLLGFMFPLGGLAVGAAGGALVGKLMGNHIDKNFVQEVEAALAPGSSALFLQVREGAADVLRAALAPYKGQIYQTSLSTELETQLRDVLKE